MLEMGKDFMSKSETFINLARNQAKKAGKTLRANKVDGGVSSRLSRPSELAIEKSTPECSRHSGVSFCLLVTPKDWPAARRLESPDPSPPTRQPREGPSGSLPA